MKSQKNKEIGLKVLKSFLFSFVFAFLLLSVSQVYASGPTTTLVSPTDVSTNTGSATFSCSATVTSGTVTSINLSIWNSTSLYYTIVSPFSAPSATLTQLVSGMPNGNYRWNCQAFDNTGYSAWAAAERTFTVNRCGNGLIDAGTTEQCDNATQNGVACIPAYNTNCTYCSATCTNITLQGGRCGDGTCQSPNENSITCLQDCPLNPCLQVQGMVSYWKGEGNADDALGLNNGTLTNGATATATGKVGNAFSFDGSNDYVSIANEDTFDFSSGSFSVELWMKSASNPASVKGLVSKHSCGYANGWIAALLTNGNLGSYYGISGHPWPPISSGGSSLANNAWHHIVYIYDKTNLRYKWYADGNLISQTSIPVSGSYNLNSISVNIGAVPCDGPSYYNGAIDEVAIYNRSLNASEIQKHYINGLAGFDYCTAPRCGDGVMDAGEQCDDGNNVTGDGCSATCTSEITSCPQGMVSYWPFNSGNANDALGRNNGTAGSGISYITGKINQALKFDGTSNAYVNMGNGDSLPETYPMTISFWMNQTTADYNAMSQWGYLVSKGYDHACAARGYYLGYNKGASAGQKIYFTSWNGSGFLYVNETLVVDGNWHNVIISIDASGLGKAYVDGVLRSSGTLTISDGSACSFYLGKNEWDQHYYKGSMDEVAIYNRSLTADEISAHYALGNAGIGYCAAQCESGIQESCYTGPANTSNVGQCHNGTRTCGSNKVWGPCTGDVTPQVETCNLADDDCNNIVDDVSSANKPACSKQSGVCAGAKQTCVTGNWQDCGDNDYTAKNASYKSIENTAAVCWDSLDNDCNGFVDKLDTNCTPGAAAAIPTCSWYDSLDLNGDGTPNVQDAVLVLRKILGYNDPTTVGRGCEAVKSA